jgi:HEAT repeat protein
MPDAMTRKILDLLDADHPAELRRAAVLVLAEIASRDADVAEALCRALADPEAAVRLAVLEAVGKLRVEQALPRLLERITEGGPESEAAAQSAARLGAKGTKALRELMGKVAPGLRRRIAGALGAAGTATAETAAVDALLDRDPGVIEAALRSLIAEVPSLTPGHREALAGRVLELLGRTTDSPLALPSETGLVRLLAALGDPRAADLFWDRLQPGHPPEMRAAALQALGKLESAPARDRLRALLTCAADRDFRVAAPALLILQPLPVQDKALADWLTLLQAPDPAVRVAGIRKLGERDSADVAEALVHQLDHPDGSLRREALACLQRLKHGRKALVKALLEAATTDAAWQLARGQAPVVREYDSGLLRQVLEQAQKYLEAGDRRADALLFLLRERNPAEVRDQLAGRAAELRAAGEYATALMYLRLLARDPACGPAIRLELAACGLKVSQRELAADFRAADPCLREFAGLVRSYPAGLTEYLEAADWLGPEELFYLGFHFVEQERQEKEFGGQVLHLLVKRSPRSKLAKDAKSKLKSAGLE